MSVAHLKPLAVPAAEIGGRFELRFPGCLGLFRLCRGLCLFFLCVEGLHFGVVRFLLPLVPNLVRCVLRVVRRLVLVAQRLPLRGGRLCDVAYRGLR